MSKPISLLDARRGMRGMILSLPHGDELRSQCIRIGLTVGAHFECMERLPGGTVVLATNRQEIALGRALAAEIGISKLP